MKTNFLSLTISVDKSREKKVLKFFFGNSPRRLKNTYEMYIQIAFISTRKDKQYKGRTKRITHEFHVSKVISGGIFNVQVGFMRMLLFFCPFSES